MKKLPLLILIICHILLLSQLRFIAWPENLLWPYLVAHGLHYYRDLFLMYPPIYWELLGAFYRVFGISLISLQVFSWGLIVITDLLLFVAAGKRWLPLLLYIPLQIFFEGNGVWVDQLLAPIFLLALMCRDRKNYLGLGLVLALAILVKQTAVYFLGGVFLLQAYCRTKAMLMARSFGVFLVAFLIILIAFVGKNLPFFFQDTLGYILSFHVKYQLQAQLPSLGQLLILVIALLPGLWAAVHKKRYGLLLLTLLAGLGAYNRFEYFHLQPALPLLALLVSRDPTALLPYLLFLPIFVRSLPPAWHREPRFLESAILDNSKVFRQYVRPGETTWFLNTWDHYYFLTDTLPAGGVFVPDTPWTMDFPGNQERMIEAVKNNLPRYVFFNDCFPVKGRCYRPELLATFLNENYRSVLKLADGTGIFEYYPVSFR